jgi:hypothetical protein
VNGATWALLSAYAQHLKQSGEQSEAERLTVALFCFEPSGRELSTAMSSLEAHDLMSAHRLTAEGLCVAEGMVRAGGL